MNKLRCLIPLCLLLVLFSCDHLSSDPDQPSGEQEKVNFVDPIVVLVDSPNFSITHKGLVRSSSTSSYIYGVLKVEYSGSEILTFVKSTMVFKDKNGSELYSDYTYIKNDGFALLSSSVTTNTYITSDLNTGYLTIIENLDDHSIDLGDIYSIDITITDSGSGSGIELIEDSPYERGTQVRESTISWYTPITNSYSSPISLGGSIGMFSDEDNKIGYWSFGFAYESDGTSWSYEDNYLDVGQQGRFRVTKVAPDYLSNDLIYYNDIIEGDIPISSISLSVQAISRSSNGKVTNDEINQMIDESVTELIELQEESITLY